MVADDPTNRIDLKTFHCQLQNDHEALAAEEAAYQNIPEVRRLSPYETLINYQRIKADIQELVTAAVVPDEE